LIFFSFLRAVYLSGTKTARAYINCGMCAINNSLNFSDVGLPRSVCFTVRVGYVATECNALSANAALSHLSYTSIIRIHL